MQADWGIIGCAYMAREYHKVLLAKGIKPQIYSRNLTSHNVESFQAMFPETDVREITEIGNKPRNWLVCTNIESHEEVCDGLSGNIYCEKPFSHHPDYRVDRDIAVLLNRRYYFWVDYIKAIIDRGKIRKIIACIPEASADALITQSIHVIDLLWHLAGPFQPATRAGDQCPTFTLLTESGVTVVVNMNYGSYENFSLRFYADDGVVYEAKPLEAFSIAEGMEVREPDDELPLRTYTPVIRSLDHHPSAHKPGLGELIDDLLKGGDNKLPTLAEHRNIHSWMQDNML